MDRRKLNGSGCYDLTAYEAIRNIGVEERRKRENEERERLKALIDQIHDDCRKAGFKLENRLILRDLKTGREWR